MLSGNCNLAPIVKRHAIEIRYALEKRYSGDTRHEPLGCERQDNVRLAPPQ
jgi:hypothetical protein